MALWKLPFVPRKKATNHSGINSNILISFSGLKDFYLYLVISGLSFFKL